MYARSFLGMRLPGCVMTLALVAILSAGGNAANAQQLTVEGTIIEKHPMPAGPDTPVEGVLVSDGLNFTRTGADGAYRLTPHGEARFIQIVIPQGGGLDSEYYKELPEDASGTLEIDFELEPNGLETGEPFNFVQVTDSHMSNLQRAELVLNEIVIPINWLSDEPAFTVESGDLMGQGTIEEYEWVKRVTDAYGAPYFPAVGNHDVPGGGIPPWKHFEMFYGPWYYAFFAGDYLFVSLPWEANAEEHLCLPWFESLLEENANNERAHVIVFVHHWEGFYDSYDAFYGLMRDYGVSAALMGHWHMARVYEMDGMDVYMNRTAQMTNRDGAEPGFMVYQAHPDGELEAEWRTSGSWRGSARRRHVHLAAPSADTGVWDSDQPLIVQAYDTSNRVRSVTVDFKSGEGEQLDSVALEQGGDWTWTARFSPGADWPDVVEAEIIVEDERDLTWRPVTQELALNGAPLPGIEVDGDWPMYKHNPQRTSAVEAAAAPPLALVWAQPHFLSYGFGSPIILGDAVYTALENNITPSDPMPAVTAFDAATGEQKWQTTMSGKTVRGTLAGGGNAVYGLADDGTIFAVDRDSGDTLWVNGALTRDDTWTELFNVSAVLADGKLAAGRGETFGVVDVEDGRTVWSHVGPGTRIWGSASPVSWNHVVLNLREQFKARDVSAGDEVWTIPHEYTIKSTPAIYDGVMYTLLAEPSRRVRRLAAVDMESGEIEWMTPEGEVFTTRMNPYSSPAVTDERVFHIDNVHRSAYDRETGDMLWREPVDYPVSGAVAVAGGYLYFVDREGNFYAIDVETGEEVWHYPLGVHADGSPAVSGNAVFVTGRCGVLYAFAAIE